MGASVNGATPSESHSQRFDMYGLVLVFWFWCALLHFKYIGGWGGGGRIQFLQLSYLLLHIWKFTSIARGQAIDISRLKKKKSTSIVTQHSFIYTFIHSTINQSHSTIHSTCLPGTSWSILQRVAQSRFKSGGKSSWLSWRPGKLTKQRNSTATNRAIFDESVWRTRTLY